MRRTTLFALLMLSLLWGLNAAAQVVFVASEAPSNGAWHTDTHWYYVTLDGKYVTLDDADDNGLKLSVKECPMNDKARWCLVGDNTSGYKFYNKSAGTEKVLGLTNIKHLETDGTNTYGGSKAQMYDATTESSSTDDTGIGTSFTYTNGTDANSYYFKLSGTPMRYFNQRGDYFSYWASNEAVNNDGSTMLFYEATAQADYNTTLNQTNAFVAKYEQRVNQVFSVPQSVIGTYKSSLPTGTITDYTAAKTQVEEALATFKSNVDAQWIRPEAGKYYTVQNAHNGRYMYAPTSTGTQLNTIDSNTKYKQFVWTFENGSTDGTYKMRNVGTEAYVAHTNNFVTSATATDLNLTISSNQYDAAGAIGLTGNQFMHSNNTTSVIDGGDTWGASRWEIQEISQADYEALNAYDEKGIDNLFGIFPNVKDDAYNTAHTTFNNTPTEECMTAWLNTAAKNVESQVYRIQNGRGTYNVLSFNASGATILNESELKKAVNDLWKFKWNNNSNTFKLYNLNADKYLSTLPSFNTENTAALTDLTQAENFSVAAYTGNDINGFFTITASDGNKINGEGDSKGCRVNNWSTIEKGCYSNLWKLLQASDIEVDMHAAGDGKTYATAYLPVSISAADAQVYVAEQPGETSVTMNETTTGVKELNGFLLVGTEGSNTATLTIGESNVTSHMTGTLTTLDLTAEDKVLYNVFGRKVEDGTTTTTVGFFTPSETLNSIDGNRGFFKGTKASALALNFGGQVTAISTAITNSANGKSCIYDLSGRRVTRVAKGGLYIVNSRKFIAK